MAGRLYDESLWTLFVEVEAIVNSRSMAVDNLNDELGFPRLVKSRTRIHLNVSIVDLVLVLDKDLPKNIWSKAGFPT